MSRCDVWCPVCDHHDFPRDVRYVPGAHFVGRRCEACGYILRESPLTTHAEAIRLLGLLEGSRPGAGGECAAWCITDAWEAEVDRRSHAHNEEAA